MKPLKRMLRPTRRQLDAQKELQFVQTLILSISQANDVQAAIGMTLSNVCETTGWTYGQAWQVRADGAALDCCPAWHTRVPGMESFRANVEGVKLSPGEGLAGRAWVFKEPVWITDIGANAEGLLLIPAQQAGFQAALSIPVMAGDEVVVVLEFFLLEPYPQVKVHISFVNMIAAQLGWLIQKKMVEEALRESVERFQLATRGSRDGLWDAKVPQEWDWNSPETPIYFSPRFKQLLGYKDDEMENNLGAWESKLHPEDRTRVLEAVRDHLEKRLPYDVEYRMRVKSGDYRWFSARGAAVWDESGRPVRMAGSLRDVTERRRLEQSLSQSEKIAAVGQLAAGIAHELNNPLHVILGYAQGLASRVLESDPMRHPIRTIEKEARRCQVLVQNFLTFARRETTGMSTVDPRRLVDEVLLLIEAQAHVRNITVFRDFLPNLPSLEVNKMQIQQVLLNLCTNAMDAMPKGGTLTIRLSVQRDFNDQKEGVLRIEVEDTGQGIPEEFHHRVFEPFFTTKEVGKGTGLGLSLVYEIVKSHHGEIALKSEVGKGSVFQVYLPLLSAREEVKHHGEPTRAS